MKLVLLLSFSYAAIAQQAPYQSFEVDSAAEPRGGMAYLTTFVQANLRKPIAAEAKGIGGLVVVKGTVEVDGHIADVSVTKSLRADCDREAVRVFKLYNAWKPARKGGQTVRQQVNIPIRFTPTMPFAYVDGKQILYFDADLVLRTDSTKQIKFKQVSPTDSNGLYTGDIVIYKFVHDKWEEYARDSLVRRPNGDKDLVGKPVFLISHQAAIQGLNGCQYTVGSSGEFLSEQCYKTGRPTGVQLDYHLNGVLARRNETVGNRWISTLWYANGQIQLIQEKDSSLSPGAKLTKVTAFWDSTGRQLVKNGNGLAKNAPNYKAMFERGKDIPVLEQGLYENSLKQGIWTGHSVDNTFSFEEHYDKGRLLTGRSHMAGEDTASYRAENQPPTFSGGLQALSDLLAANLRYPDEARKEGAEGRVIVSCLVRVDGTLGDCTVVRSVHPDIDREALRVIQKTSGQWQPAIQQGKKVALKVAVPINFSLTR